MERWFFLALTLTALKHYEQHIIAQNFIYKQANDSYRRQAISKICLLGSTSNYDRNAFLTGVVPIDGAVEKCFPTSLSSRLLYYSQYSGLVIHPGERRMYNMTRR